ncbi:hypothetical protein M3689_16305 [Alkalihalophilus marmarensis]|jgi:hypothetical protein|uniref:Uncharacterized protein n=1 Tax=Alkalihalophilus marmarensis DSM 21297 TaxID=1188261 RepID=U6SRX7_9BACI|nr:hypothetical protein [Alkalihalophilus marmarensis]ERN53386.1 hypothetical protein A33I_11545 [Alkalihalophilus marmarensis DSM 21297]MCM3490872.1 hypothetical protein [Alkalihalophilus marmarensis]
MIEFYLALDERGLEDTFVIVDDIPFIYDHKALDEIGSYLKVDFIGSQGLKLINSNQTLAYGLKLKRL